MKNKIDVKRAKNNKNKTKLREKSNNYFYGATEKTFHQLSKRIRGH